MAEPIEITIRQGRDYMSPAKRSVYCQFQTADATERIAEELTKNTNPGPHQMRHAATVSRYVKTNIEYNRTGMYPRATDVLLRKSPEGDCVDQSVLLMSLLEAIGVDARYCCFKQRGKTVGHCVVEIAGPSEPVAVSEVEESLRSQEDVGDGSPITWDIDDQGRWLLVDPTINQPVGFDPGEGFNVTSDGVQWRSNYDVVCFRPHR